MKSAFCRYQSPEGRGCYPWGQFCAGASPMAQPTSMGQKIWSLALFVATVKVCVKAFEGMECTNVYIFATRPSIKVLSMHCTLPLLILVLWPLKYKKRKDIWPKTAFESVIAYFFFSFTSSMELLVNFGQISFLIKLLRVTVTKIESWRVKRVLRILSDGFVAEI